MNVAVVDDRRDVLEGRVRWLHAAGHLATGFTFEEALNEYSWQGFDVVVLDGRDDGEHAREHGAGQLPDRFLGPRVAAHICTVCKDERPRLTLISAYARIHPELSLRCQEAGVDYAFDYLDVPNAEHFVRAVEDPRSMAPRKPTDWRTVGFVNAPNIQAALAEAEESTASRAIISGNKKPSGVSAYEIRRLRETLGNLLPIPKYRTGERQRLLHTSELRPLLRRLLGINPTDARSPNTPPD